MAERRDTTLNVDREKLAHVCRNHHIKRLSLFGSQLSGEARDDSDVDMLVEFEPGQTPGLLRLAEIEAELSPLFGGHPIDLRTAQDLSRHFREQVVREAQVQYAQ